MEEAMHVIERLKGVEIDGVRYDCELSHRTQRKLEKEEVSRFATERLHKSHQQTSSPGQQQAAMPASVSQQMESRPSYPMPSSSSMVPMVAMSNASMMMSNMPPPYGLQQHPQHPQHQQQHQQQYSVSMQPMVYPSPTPQYSQAGMQSYMPGVPFPNLPPSVFHLPLPVLSAASHQIPMHMINPHMPVANTTYVMPPYPQMTHHHIPQHFMMGGYSPLSTSSTSNYGTSPYSSIEPPMQPMSSRPPSGVHIIEDQYHQASKKMRSYHT
ncbi:hypothetical protein EON65_29035 [archaeon]|nr:MAG: hypothetical protein EON65_29035 [archaeon]